MPTSVLLAVLAAASLLALAPALVRRYDATERLVAERTSSTARVLARQRRRRTVPGRTPVNPPLAVLQAATDGPVATGSDAAVRSGAARAGAAGDGAGAGRGHDPVVPRPRDPVDRRRWWRRRRRRVLGVLAVLCLTEATGAVLLGPGFLAGLTASLTLFLWYAAVLRNRVLVAQRHRRHQARIAARHAAAGAADRRIAAEKQRRIAEARRAAQTLVRQRDEPWWPTPGPVEDQPSRSRGLRGQAYEARAANF